MSISQTNPESVEECNAAHPQALETLNVLHDEASDTDDTHGPIESRNDLPTDGTYDRSIRRNIFRIKVGMKTSKPWRNERKLRNCTRATRGISRQNRKLMPN